jgi:diamine N-acetyltransferase
MPVAYNSVMTTTTVPELQFIPATLTDVEALADIAKRIYWETFAKDNDPVELQKYLNDTFNPTQLTQLVNNPNYHIWLARNGEELAGYCTLRDEAAKYDVIPGTHPIEIERFYLDTPYHGKGHAQQMMAFCLTQADQLGADVVWLGVWEHNPRAERFYQKFGFTRVGQHDFWIGNDCQNDWLMAKSL